MKVQLAIAIIIFTKISVAQEHCERLIPSKANDWHFARVIFSIYKDNSERAAVLDSACTPWKTQHSGWKQIDSSSAPGLFPQTVKNFRLEALKSFLSKLPESERVSLTKEFEEIKKEPSAEQRVAKTYELFLRYKKPYNQSRNGRTDLLLSPEVTLTEGGVCRDFATLLYSMLHEVSLVSSNNVNSSFQLNAPMTYNHMWVSVELPHVNHATNILSTQRIDLDPTNFTDKFTPLMPLNQGLGRDELNRNYEICRQIIDCLSPPVHHLVPARN